MKVLNKVTKVINKICNGVMVICLLIMFAVLLLTIFSRFVAFVQLTWAQDVIIYLMIVTVFLGVGSATAAGKQINLEFFVDLFPKKARNVFTIIADIISIVFLGIVIYQTLVLGGQSLNTKVGASPFRLCWYYWVIGTGCFIMIINYINMMVLRLCNHGKLSADMEQKNKEECDE